MNKEKLVEELQETTARSLEECLLIVEICHHHCTIGRKNKKRIIADFINQLDIDDDEANQLYNQCMENILKGILRS